MNNEARWHDLGPVEELSRHRLRQVTIGRTRIALTFKDGRFGAISGACNHAGGPLGEGHHDGDYVVCPWHHCRTSRIRSPGRCAGRTGRCGCWGSRRR